MGQDVWRNSPRGWGERADALILEKFTSGLDFCILSVNVQEN